MLAHRAGPLLVLGGPGTGKTSLVVELAAARVRAGLDPAQLLVLAPSRGAAGELRDRVAARVGRTIREPLARTAHSYAFGLLRRDAVLRSEPTPRLLASAEQELMIAELLAHSTAPWPAEIWPALRTRHFAGQVRDLLLRAVERGLSTADLVRLGQLHDKPLWVAAGHFGHEYAGVTALAHPSAYDPAELVRAAVDLLRSDAALMAAERQARALVVVDDVDEADPAMLDLLELLAGGGDTLVATADPDSTVYGFRGADPLAVHSFSTRFRSADGAAAPQVVLPRSYRLTAAVAAPVARTAARLGGAGSWRPQAAGSGDRGSFGTAVLASTSDEMAHVAALLRRRHLTDGVPWAEMAVVTRSAADLSAMRRSLARHGVPVVQRTAEVSLWQQAPVRALLDLLALVVDHDAATDERVVDLLLGPLGGLDPARLVRLRRDLVVAGRGQPDTVPPDHLIADVVAGRCAFPSTVRDTAVLRLADTVQRGRAAAVDGSVEQVLWELWEGVGVAQRWRSLALSGQRDAPAADRDLDAVVALFEAAARFTDRMPGAGPVPFLDHVRAQQIPGESWTSAAPVGDAVSVLTAHATKGRQWHTVVVCRVQEDLWPDLRRRQSLLAVEQLVAVVDTGRSPSVVEQTTQLLAEERRLFHLALSRAAHTLLVTAVDDGELRPSRLVGELRSNTDEPVEVQAASAVLTLPALVAELRAAVCDPERAEPERTEAARVLAQVADSGVRGAHPDDWYGLAPASQEGPLVGDGDPVRLSPSQIEGYLRCPLRWMLQRAGADTGTALRQTIGTLVHELAAEAATQRWTAEQVWARYEQLWSTVDAGRGWVATRERARVDAMVGRLVDWLERHPDSCLGTEIEITTNAGRATVSGRLDRLDRGPDGRVVVVDFKTGTSAPTRDEVATNAQLGVYQWAVGAGAAVDVTGDECVRPGGGMLVHLGIPGTSRAKEQEQPALDDSADPEWPHALVQQVTDGVTGDRFRALVNPGCGHCPVRSSCPAQPDGGRVVP